MNKDCKDKGCDWIRENYGVTFKCIQEKTYESTMPMMKENAWKRQKKWNPI